MNPRSTLLRRQFVTAIPILLVLFLMPIGNALGNHSAINSTEALALACAEHAGVVDVLVPATISAGPRPGEPPTLVPNNCTIRLASQVKFEIDHVGMDFQGGFAIAGMAGATKVDVIFNGSHFASGQGMALDLPAESVFVVESSTLEARAGDLSIAAGPQVNMKANKALGMEPATLRASGAITLSGGARFQAMLADAEVQAGTGINVSLSGMETAFTVSTSNLATQQGPVSITALGEKAKVEFVGDTVKAGHGISMSLNGNESDLKLLEMMGAPPTVFGLDAGTGDIRLETLGEKTKVSVSVSSLKADPTAGNVTVQASINGALGDVVVEEVLVEAGQATTGSASPFVKIESGPRGYTTAIANSLTGPGGATSTGTVRIATNPPGLLCKQDENFILANFQELCQ